MNFFTKNEIIEIAVEMEEKGFFYYQKALEKSDLSEKAIKILMYLKNEEKKHQEVFRNLRDGFDDIDLKDHPDWNEVRSYINALLDSHIFNEEDAALKLINKAETDKEIIKFAMIFEKDTLLFFHSLKKFISNKSFLEIVDKIIKEEESHLIKLISLHLDL
jgi:rubrerythrin